MDYITFSQIEALPMTADDTRIAMEASMKPLDSLTRDEFIKVLHFYDLYDLTHSESECKRLLMKHFVIPG